MTHPTRCLHPFAVVLFMCATANAEPPEPDPGPEYQQAMSEAKAAFQAGQFAEAAGHFEKAYQIAPRVNLLFNIGLAHEKAKDPLKAAQFYTRYLAAETDAGKADRARQKLAALQGSLAELLVEVEVKSEPAGAVIFVDNKSQGAMGTTPLVFKLLPGSYTLIAELKDHETVRKAMNLGGGKREVIELRLVKSADVGSLRLLIPEIGAAISVDGSSAGMSPLDEPLRLAVGPHEITVTKQGLRTSKQQVTIAAGKLLTLQVDLMPEGDQPAETGGYSANEGVETGDPTWAYVTMGAGGVLLIGGTITGLLAQSLHDELEDKHDGGEAASQSDVDSGNTLTLTTNILLITGGVAVVAGGVWWFLETRAPSETTAEIVAGPGLSPEGNPTLLLQGSF